MSDWESAAKVIYVVDPAEGCSGVLARPGLARLAPTLVHQRKGEGEVHVADAEAPCRGRSGGHIQCGAPVARRNVSGAVADGMEKRETTLVVDHQRWKGYCGRRRVCDMNQVMLYGIPLQMRTSHRRGR